MTQTAVNSPLATPVMNTMAPREFLSFRLGAQEYGVDLLKVQEIRSYQEPTRIANAPACVRGVLNLRGVIVPVIDLRTLLGMSNPRFDTVTVTVVVNVGDQVIGGVVDAVSDVVSVEASQMRPLPELDGVANSELFSGLAALDERMLLLVNLDALLKEVGIQHDEPELAH